MDLAMIVLRLFHIFGAACWIGWAFFLAFFLGPAAGAAGPAGGAVMRAILTRTKFMAAMPAVAVLTIVSGFVLIFKDSAGFDPAWMGSKTGIAYSAGAGLGVVAGAIGGHTGGMIGARMA